MNYVVLKLIDVRYFLWTINETGQREWRGSNTQCYFHEFVFRNFFTSLSRNGDHLDGKWRMISRNGIWRLCHTSPRWQAVTVSENWHFQLADHDHTDFHSTNGHICQDNLHFASIFWIRAPQYLVKNVPVTTNLKSSWMLYVNSSHLRSL